MDSAPALQSPAAGAGASIQGDQAHRGTDPGPLGGHPEAPVMAPPPANPASEPPRAADPITDTIKAEPTAPVLSPALALTPATNVGAGAQVPATASTPFADPLLSPVRPAAAVLGAAAPSPIPPPSAGKQEVADAAMALTWLAEALTAPADERLLAAPAPAPAPRRKTFGGSSLRTAASLPRSESSGSRRKAASASLYASLEKADSELTVAAPAPQVTTGLRGRRAASQRCTTVIQEAIMNERLLAANPRAAAAAEAAEAPVGRAPRRATTARATETAAAAAERKLKGYSENSRVGRAMAAILHYVEEHEPQYAAASGGGGVPERVIRGEFGNNPDTSKALRFLVGEKKIVRKGLGGRRDPFNYVLAEGVTPGPAAAAARAVTAAAAAAAPDVAAPAPAPALVPVFVPARATSPTESAEENAGVNGQGPSFLSPPAADPASAAAAAALNAPSTGKWPATAPRRTFDGPSRRKPLQPRLSLGMAEALPGVKRPASTAAGPPAKRAAMESPPEAVAATPAAATAVAFAMGGQPPSTAVAASKTGSLVTPASELIQAHVAQQAQQAAQGVSGILAWPSQLPSTQRLSTLASPPPLTTTPAPAPVFLVPSASAGLLRATGGAATPQHAAQAYMLQLQAAQMLLRQQMAAQAAGQGVGAPTLAPVEEAPQAPTLTATQQA